MEQLQIEAEESFCASVPPGFRFHPTEEELVGYYLSRKVAGAARNHKIDDLDIIQELDLYRMEPWDLQEKCNNNNKYGGEQTAEWYFFSYKDRKYPSGTRTNRATAAGFWKATGRDKAVVSSRSSRVMGMRKTLVFYKGRAPNGSKTHWIMHEYRLVPQQEEEAATWVVCRAFRKPLPINNNSSYYYCYPHRPLYNDLCSLMESPTTAATTTTVPAAQQRNDEPTTMIHGEGGQAAVAIDWTFLDTFLSTTSHLHDPSDPLLLPSFLQ